MKTKKNDRSVQAAADDLKAYLAFLEIRGFDPKILYLALTSVVNDINKQRLEEIKKELSMGELNEAK